MKFLILFQDYFDLFQGRLYDSNGNLKDWWGKNSSKNFVSKKGCVIEQYQGFKDLQTNLSVSHANHHKMGFYII